MEENKIYKVVYKDDLDFTRVKILIYLKLDGLQRVFINPKNGLEENIPDSSIIRAVEVKNGS